MLLPKYLIKGVFTLFILFLCPFFTFATHIKAGEITAARDPNNPYRYNFTLNLYCDSAARQEVLNSVSPATFKFSDGGSTSVSVATGFPQQIGNSTLKYVFNFSYVFQSSGRFAVSYLEENRNDGIINMSNSVNTPFFISTSINLNPFLGLNSAPVFTIPPIDLACGGQAYLHNPGVYDPDGDSIAYKMFVPQKGEGIFVDNYRDPNNPNICAALRSNCTPTGFSIDPYTGTITWDSPYYLSSTQNLYNIAFVVEEWRNGILLSTTLRDMQIKVNDCQNNPPKIIVPKRLCVMAGKSIRDTITVTDPDRLNNRSITLFGTGGPFNVSSSPATLTQILNRAWEVWHRFQWNTNCSHVRKEDYVAYFRALDRPPLGKSLVDIKTWNIKVVAAAPEGLKVSQTNGNVVLKWKPYAKTSSCASIVDSIYIWRANGCPKLKRDTCSPNNLGNYVIIGAVKATDSTFTDKTIKKGNTYSYLLNAHYNDAQGYDGVSLPSKDTCITLPITAPIITEVSVLTTDTVRGKISVRWIKPINLDSTSNKGPFGYKVYRQNGTTSGFVLIATKTSIKDTSLVDSLLNTTNRVYAYKILLTYENGKTLDSGEVAYNVRLIARGTPRGVLLTWNADVPWANTLQYHYIYRKVDGVFVLIDSTFTENTSMFQYQDLGTYKNTPLLCSKVYTYYVATKGTYNNPLIYSPLLNNSQITFATPSDTVLPPPPTTQLAPIDCQKFNETDVKNTLTWVNNQAKDALSCRKILGYNVYFSEYEGDELKFLQFVSDTFYIHKGVPYSICSGLGGGSGPYNSLAGCYAVTALDSSRNESKKSNIVCKDNCIRYELPNIFTPNGDDKNDLFRPILPIRYVTCITNFDILNRWGAKVGSPSSDIYLDWNGKLNANELPEGMYYYQGKIKFKRLRRSEEEINYKGYFQIMR